MRTRFLAAVTTVVAILSIISTAATPVHARRPAGSPTRPPTSTTSRPPSRPPTRPASRNPVIIVPGILVGPLDEFVYYPLRDRLRAAGHDTSFLTKPWYGVDGVGPNAERLAQLVDDVRARTGAAKVDLVAHSQGGLVSRHFIKYLGGADVVGHAVLMASPNQGTLAVDLVDALVGCLGLIGCQEMATYSPYLAALNAGDQTIGDVRYTTIVTRYDELAVPHTTGFLPEDHGNVVNVDIQAQCPNVVVEHLFMLFSGAVADGVIDALDDRRVRLDCDAP